MYLNLNFSHDPNKSQDVHYPKYEDLNSITGAIVYNEEKADVEEVDAGLMAVRVPGRQTSDIKFVYHTPLLKEGCIISGAAVVALAIYLIIFKGFRAKRKFRRTYRIKQNTRKMRRIL